ncbi:GNAT family N-acetyltransferase [uncultured Psychromonas sp.]|uniref:GNAT family N-acetyltransferase n=1 Tax=uncultured Psychromonas sp. TaxID=173974 RepID=UPI002605FAEA|nr:GNAT family N-acetyltransferase [uncultured Psychromonas sp.]
MFKESRSIIEPCHLSQVHLLQDVAIRTYQETFSDSNSEALLQQYYKESLSIEKLSAQLQNNRSEFYFIYTTSDASEGTSEDISETAPKNTEAKLAGFLKLNVDDAQTDIFDTEALEVEKIYILKDFLAQGLGKKLISFAVDRAIKQNKKYLWLGVWEHNFPALRFYQKMGFEQFGEHDFNMGGDIQKDLLLKRVL